MSYSLTLAGSEWQYARGRHSENEAAIAHLRLAAAWFPLEHWFRSGPAEYYTIHRWKGSRPAAIAELRAAIRADPYSASLHRSLAGFLYEDGNPEGAGHEIAVIHAITPRSKIDLFVNVNPDTR